MILYLDTSAYVRVYIREAGHGKVPLHFASFDHALNEAAGALGAAGVLKKIPLHS